MFKWHMIVLTTVIALGLLKYGKKDQLIKSKEPIVEEQPQIPPKDSDKEKFKKENN